MVEAVRDITSGKMASVVVECTGTAPGMNLALDLARPLGRVSLPGLPHAGQQVPLPANTTDCFISPLQQ